MRCENCSGTGKIIEHYIERRGVYKTRIIKCFLCEGKGEIKSEETQSETQQAEEQQKANE